MKIFNELSSRIDVSLNLTVATEVGQFLRRGMGSTRDLLVTITTVSALLASLSTEIVQSGTSSSSVYSVSSMTSLTRRLAVLVFSDTVLKMVSPPSGEIDSTVVSRDLEHAMSMELHPTPFSRIPLTALHPVESFAMSSILVVLAGFLSKQVSKAAGGGDDIAPSAGVPEIRKITSSFQYQFADAAGGLLLDRGIKRIIATVGLVAISPIASYVSGGQGSSNSLWVGGVAMAWVNLIVSLVVPEVGGSTSPVVDVVGVLALLVTMQAITPAIPGLSVLSGYVEWHLSAVISSTASSRGCTEFDIAVLAVSFLAAVYTLNKGWRPDVKESSSFTLIYGTASLVAVNSMVRYIMNIIKISSPEGSISVVVGGIILSKALVHVVGIWAALDLVDADSA